MTDPSTAAVSAIRLADVPSSSADLAPGEARFHLVRRHFDVQSFGVNGASGNEGDQLITEHDERADSDYGTEGHEELFVVVSGHAVFTVAGEEIDAPAGTLVFVRDPASLRSARALVDGTSALAMGGRPGVPFAVSRWEQAIE